MSHAAKLIDRIEILVSEYGVDAVRNGLTFVATFNSQCKAVRVQDATGKVFFDLTREEYTRVCTSYWNGYMSTENQYIPSKIQAIKTLREITACSLKEAKDVVENTTWVFI